MSALNFFLNPHNCPVNSSRISTGRYQYTTSDKIMIAVRLGFPLSLIIVRYHAAGITFPVNCSRQSDCLLNEKDSPSCSHLHRPGSFSYVIYKVFHYIFCIELINDHLLSQIFSYYFRLIIHTNNTY